MIKNRIIISFIMFFQLSACFDEEFKDVSTRREFKKYIGMHYKIIGVVDAYGIRDYSKPEIKYVTLIPRPGIAGPEVGFEFPVEIGSVIKINKVLKSNRIFDHDISFEISIDQENFPKNVPIRIDLYRGNKGEGVADLNNKIYQR